MHLLRRRAPVGVVAIVVGLVLAGCAVEREPVPSPTADDFVDGITQPRLVDGEIPELIEGGTAEDNLDYFVFRLEALVAQVSQPSSRQIVDELVDSGFAKGAMEVTADSTPTGSRADSILVAVKLDDGCLLGQVSDSGLASDTAPVLSTGRCLVGRTLSIDW